MTEEKKTLSMPRDKYLVRMKNILHENRESDGPYVEKRKKRIYVIQENPPFIGENDESGEMIQDVTNVGAVGEALIKAAQKGQGKELESLRTENADLKKEIECLKNINKELEETVEKLNNTIHGLANSLCDKAAQNIIRNQRSKNREELKNGMGYGSADFATKGNWYRGYKTDPNDEK